MGNNMSKHMKQAAGDNDIFPDNSTDKSGKDAQAASISAISMIDRIFEYKYVDLGAFENYYNPSEQALKTCDWNFGFSWYLNEWKYDFDSLMQMKSFGDNKMPYPMKDVRCAPKM